MIRIRHNKNNRKMKKIEQQIQKREERNGLCQK